MFSVELEEWGDSMHTSRARRGAQGGALPKWRTSLTRTTTCLFRRNVVVSGERSWLGVVVSSQWAERKVVDRSGNVACWNRGRISKDDGGGRSVEEQFGTSADVTMEDGIAGVLWAWGENE